MTASSHPASPATVFRRIFRLLLLMSLPMRAIYATGQAMPEPQQRIAGKVHVDRAELEAFMDGVMAAQFQAHHISGAAVSVVGGSQVILSKGYGFADISRGKRVDPDRTLFRIGSVTKLFTWTAVMQLVEQGKLDLDKDVNAYLSGLQVPATYPTPVTMTHLMTHTPGFEERVVGLFSGTPDSLKPLAEILARDLPARVRPPGALASYSNHGTALAGLIVQQLSRTRWEEYVERKIFGPLGMKHATARQPIPADLASDMSIGYRFTRGEYKPGGFEFVPMGPAGSISASATDMAYFMLACLQNGRLGQARILSDATALRMRQRLFTHHPKLNGMLHGFIEMNRDGVVIIGHGGDTFLFHTILMLFPESGVGLFASYNCDTGARARSELQDAFLSHYYAQGTSKPAKARPSQRLDRYIGRYAPTRVSHTTLAKIARLMTTINVSATSDGRLTTEGGESGARIWIEQEPMLFREADGQRMMAFRQNDRGQITNLFFGSAPPIAFIRLSSLEGPAFHFTLAGICVALLLSALFVCPIRAYLDRDKRRYDSPPRLARLLAWLNALLIVAFLAGLYFILSNPGQIAFGIPPILRRLLFLPLTACLLTAGIVCYAVMAWKKRYWHGAARLYYSALTLASLVLLAWLHHWNLLGFRY